LGKVWSTNRRKLHSSIFQMATRPFGDHISMSSPHLSCGRETMIMTSTISSLSR
jgi:hypothetical protein